MSSPFCFNCAEHLRLRGHLPAGCISREPGCDNFKATGIRKPVLRRVKGVVGH